MSPLPDVPEVLWPAERNDENGIDADIVARSHVARSEALRGHHYPPEPPGIDRHRCGFRGGASLHLDERDDPAPPGDHVDFPARDPRATRKDVPAVKTEEPACDGLGSPAALLGGLAIHFDSSSARA